MHTLSSTSIEDIINRLAAIPLSIAQTTELASETDIHTPPVQGQWSIAEISAHIRASDDILMPRVYAILVRDQPALAAYNERYWAEIAGYAQADFYPSLMLFTLRRAELVDVLRQLTHDDWQRIGIHEERGPMSLVDMVRGWVEHEEEHHAQMAAISIR